MVYKQKAYKKTIGRLLMQDARIISPQIKGTHSEFKWNTNSRKKKEIFSIIAGLAGLTYEGISAYLN